MEESAKIPDYKRIYLHYRNLIIDGTLSPGDRLPTGKDMADEWNVSDATTRRAMAILKDEGLTIATTRAGTVVARSSVGFSGNIGSASLVRQSADVFGEGATTTYTYAGYEEAPADVAEALQIQLGDEVIRRSRHRKIGDRPITMSTSWHPAEQAYAFPRLLVPENFDEGLTAIENATNLKIGSLKERVAASLATQEHAEFFGFELPEAVLLKEHLWHDANGGPFCFGQGVHRQNEWSEYKVVIDG